MSQRTSTDLTDREAEIVLHEERDLTRGFWRITAQDVTLKDAAGDVRFTREILHVGKVAVVLPYDPVRDAVVMIRQFRLPAHVATGRGDLVEVVAGINDPGEEIEATARRELMEEAGLDAKALHFLLDSVPAAGTLAEHCFHYVAHVDAGSLPARAGLDAESEVIRPFLVPADEAIEAAFAGAFMNAHALVAVMAFSRRRVALREAWTA